MRTTTKKHPRDSYFDFVSSFALRRLRSTGEHAKAKRVYLRLSGSASDPGTRDYLDVLADLIGDFERRSEQTVDTRSVSAAEIVRHRLEERGMSVTALARETAIPPSKLSDMIHGRRGWSTAAIRSLSQRLNIRAERFLE